MAGSPYAQAIQEAHSLGLHVWLGADLAARWLQGPESFRAGVQELGRLASLPGVVGIKIADELGYHDGFDNHFDRIMAFLRASADALRRVAPGKLILIDILVPQLGCAPGVQAVAAYTTQCMAERVVAFPHLTLQHIDAMFASHTIDVVDLSTYLASESTYSTWGITIDEAQAAAWQEVSRRGWASDVTLHARKAMAFPGTYSGDKDQVNRALRTYVGIPTSSGAEAVDIWTWRQTYDDRIVHLMDPGLAPNPLWRGLVRLHDQGVHLFTHFTPSTVDRSVRADLTALSKAFSSVYMAAGIG
jgi:hypothetical protein